MKGTLFVAVVRIDIPEMNEYYEYFGPEYKLDVKASTTVDDMNTAESLGRIKRLLLENLRRIGGPPSVQMSGKNYQQKF